MEGHISVARKLVCGLWQGFSSQPDLWKVFSTVKGELSGWLSGQDWSLVEPMPQIPRCWLHAQPSRTGDHVAEAGPLIQVSRALSKTVQFGDSPGEGWVRVWVIQEVPRSDNELHRWFCRWRKLPSHLHILMLTLKKADLARVVGKWATACFGACSAAWSQGGVNFIQSPICYSIHS